MKQINGIYYNNKNLERLAYFNKRSITFTDYQLQRYFSEERQTGKTFYSYCCFMERIEKDNLKEVYITLDKLKNNFNDVDLIKYNHHRNRIIFIEGFIKFLDKYYKDYTGTFKDDVLTVKKNII